MRWLSTLFVTACSGRLSQRLQALADAEFASFYDARELSAVEIDDVEHRLRTLVRIVAAANGFGLAPLDGPSSRRLLGAARSAGAPLDVLVNLAFG